MNARVGIGYDVHKLVPERKLILGGVEIPFEKGLLGHSDADVIAHAVMDSLLGAAGLGDIGRHFPDSDDKYKNISSLKLLREVKLIIEKSNYIVSNIDGVIVAQKPRLSPYIDNMEQNMADALGIDKSRINIKATTEEWLGFTGEGLGIAAKAVCCIISPIRNKE